MMTITRIAGKDDYSNLIDRVTYEGELDSEVKVGDRIWFTKGGSLFNTGYLVKIKKNIVRTSKAVYEINY